jgi:hypothetical protein
MPHDPIFLKIEVKRNDTEDSFETNLHCSRNHCGEIVYIDSDGSETIQRVSCPKHGVLISFPPKIALLEFARCLANKTLAASGEQTNRTGSSIDSWRQ